MTTHRFRTIGPRNTTAAGYGSAHQKARREAVKRHHPADPCARCGHALGPMGPHLHYDHNGQRTGYLGFSHGAPCPTCGQRCNIRAAAIEGNRRQRGRRHGAQPSHAHSRAW